MRFGNVMDLESIRTAAFQDKVDVVVSCLASRTGEYGGRRGWNGNDAKIMRAPACARLKVLGGHGVQGKVVCCINEGRGRTCKK